MQKIPKTVSKWVKYVKRNNAFQVLWHLNEHSDLRILYIYIHIYIYIISVCNLIGRMGLTDKTIYCSCLFDFYSCLFHLKIDWAGDTCTRWRKFFARKIQQPTWHNTVYILVDCILDLERLTYNVSKRLDSYISK